MVAENRVKFYLKGAQLKRRVSAKAINSILFTSILPALQLRYGSLAATFR